MSKPQASKRARNIKRIERTDRPPKPQPEEEGRYMGPEENQVVEMRKRGREKYLALPKDTYYIDDPDIVEYLEWVRERVLGC